MKTDDLIATLARDVAPVRPLVSPAIRLAGWLSVAFAGAAAGIWVFGARPDAVDLLQRPDSLVTAILAVGTTTFAAAAALVLAIPGAERSPVLRAAAMTLVTVWAIVLVGAAARSGVGVAGDVHWPICFVRVVAIGFLPALVLVVMIRRALPLRLSWTSGLTATAAMGIAAGAIQFICPIDNPAHALLGHFAPIVVLGAIAAWVAPRLSK